MRECDLKYPVTGCDSPSLAIHLPVLFERHYCPLLSPVSESWCIDFRSYLMLKCW